MNFWENTIQPTANLLFLIFKAKAFHKVNNKLCSPFSSLLQTKYSINLLHQIELESNKHQAVQPGRNVCVGLLVSLGPDIRFPASEAPRSQTIVPSKVQSSISGDLKPHTLGVLLLCKWPKRRFISSSKCISFFSSSFNLLHVISPVAVYFFLKLSHL